MCPLKIKLHLTLKRTIIAHLAFVIAIAIWMQLAVVLVFDLVPTPGTLFGVRCIIHPKYGLFGLLVGIPAQQMQYSVHTIINLVIIFLTLIQLYKGRKRRKDLVASRFMNFKLPRNEIKSTITILLISLSSTLFYIPCAITWPLYAYYAAIPIRTEEENIIYLHSAKLSHTFLLLTGSVRIINFVLLVCNVPSFRMTIHEYCFKMKNFLLGKWLNY